MKFPAQILIGASGCSSASNVQKGVDWIDKPVVSSVPAATSSTALYAASFVASFLVNLCRSRVSFELDRLEAGARSNLVESQSTSGPADADNVVLSRPTRKFATRRCLWQALACQLHNNMIHFLVLG